MMQRNSQCDKDKPISVIMATYNGSRFLEEQINSILDQNLPVSEILVCDDNSDDSTIEILKTYSASGRIKFQVNANRLGVVENFKKAASLADKSNYVALADQDDIWMKEKLEVSMNALVNFEDKAIPCMIYSDPMVIDQKGEEISKSFWKILRTNNYIHSFETILFGNSVQGCTTLMNPELAKYIASIPSHIKGHDAWLALCAYTFGKAKIVQGPLIKYRQHDTNVTFSTAHKQISRLQRILNEISLSIKGKSNLFLEQFLLVNQFYESFQGKIDPVKKRIMEEFLALQSKSYLQKKIAFRKVCDAVSKKN